MGRFYLIILFNLNIIALHVNIIPWLAAQNEVQKAR